jgi:hypothetical protein
MPFAPTLAACSLSPAITLSMVFCPPVVKATLFEALRMAISSNIGGGCE